MSETRTRHSRQGEGMSPAKTDAFITAARVLTLTAAAWWLLLDSRVGALVWLGLAVGACVVALVAGRGKSDED